MNARPLELWFRLKGPEGAIGPGKVRLLQAVGSDKVIRTARSLGITAPMAEGDPSLALRVLPPACRCRFCDGRGFPCFCDVGCGASGIGYG